MPGHDFLGQVFNVGVATFLLISGYLYGPKKLSGFTRWFKKRILQIWIPTAVIIIFDAVSLLIFYNRKYDFVTYVAYLLNLHGLLRLNPTVFGQYITKIDNLGPLWFTTIIMFCYLLVFPLQSLSARLDKFRGKKAGISILVCFVLLIISLGIQLTTGFISVYFVIFIFGYLFAAIEQSIIRNRYIVAIIYIICGGLQFLRLFLLRIADNTSLYLTYTSLSHFALAVGLFVLFLRIGTLVPSLVERIGKMKAVVYIDKYSFFVYLTHGLFCMGETNFFIRNNIIISSLLFFLCTAVASCLLKIIVDCLAKHLTVLSATYNNL